MTPPTDHQPTDHSPSDHPAPATDEGGRNPATQELPLINPAPARQRAVTEATQQPAVQPPGVQPTGPVDFVPGLPAAAPESTPERSTPRPLPPPPSAPRTRPEPVVTAPRPPDASDASDEPGEPAGAGRTRMWPDTLEDQADGETDDRAGEVHVDDEVAVDDAPGTARPRRGTPPAGSRARRPRDRMALVGLGLAALSVALVEVGLSLGFGGVSLWSAIPLWAAFATACSVLALLAFVAFYPAGNRRRSGPAWRVAAGGLVGLAAFWLLVVLPDVASDRGFVLTAGLACLGGALWVGPRRRD